MGRKQMATVAEVEAMATRCRDLADELMLMCDSVDRSFHDEALMDGVSVESARGMNYVSAAAAQLNVKILALIAMRELRKGDAA